MGGPVGEGSYVIGFSADDARSTYTSREHYYTVPTLN